MSLSLSTITLTTFPYTQKLPTFSPKIVPKRSSYISCNQNQQKESNMDRRNVLIGLGTLGASPVLTNTGAMADPILTPEPSPCHEAYDNLNDQKVTCCRQLSVDTVDFVFPDPTKSLRIRRPTNKLTSKEITRFKEGIRRMKALDTEDPRSFFQQAQIHCAFCQDAYSQPGYPKIPIQVHGSWLFPAWHRFYLYFWEKVLRNLLEDDTFAIPYWNWSDPDSMKFPTIYIEKMSPLYNDSRNHNHYDALLDLNYTYNDPNPTPGEAPDVILKNLILLNNDFREGKFCPTAFMGGILTAGEAAKEEYGSLETVHNTIHQWVGPSTSPYWDMGNLHTAARDTIFFGHHANIDRLWNTYQLTRDMEPEFNTPDWLDASFVFPDPDVPGQVINCKANQSLDPAKLGYTYESVRPEDQAFYNIRPRYLEKRKADKQKATKTIPITTFPLNTSEPISLNKSTSIILKRPKAYKSEPNSLNKSTKKEQAAVGQAVEILVLDDIEYEDDEHARLDVYVAKPTDGTISSDFGELVGSYVRIPNSHNGREKAKSSKKFGITNLIGDIEAEDSDNLVVTVVPRLGKLKIGRVSIKLAQD